MGALAVIGVLAAQVAAPPAATSSSSVAGNGSRPGSVTYVDLEAGAGYSTNPVLGTSGDSGAGFGRFSINAVHRRLSARTSTALSAYAQEFVYTNRYGSQQSFDLNASHSARVNERLSVYGNGSLSYDKGGRLDTRVLDGPDLQLPPGTVVPPPLLPPGSDFLSVTGRTYQANADIGGQLVLGPRDSVSGSAGVQHLVAKNGQFDTRYTTIPVSIAYNRQLSPRTSIGVRLGAQRTGYSGPARARSITPQLTISTLLSERLSFNGSVGATFGSVEDGLTRRHSTGIAADANLCSVGELSQLCARASINQQVATAAGSSKSISLGVQYSRRLDEAQTLSLSLDGNRYSSPVLQVTNLSFSHATYVRGAAEYARKFSGHWYGGANLAARKLTLTGPDPKADVTGVLFIRYRLGNAR